MANTKFLFFLNKTQFLTFFHPLPHLGTADPTAPYRHLLSTWGPAMAACHLPNQVLSHIHIGVSSFFEPDRHSNWWRCAPWHLSWPYTVYRSVFSFNQRVDKKQNKNWFNSPIYTFNVDEESSCVIVILLTQPCVIVFWQWGNSLAIRIHGSPLQPIACGDDRWIRIAKLLVWI